MYECLGFLKFINYFFKKQSDKICDMSRSVVAFSHFIRLSTQHATYIYTLKAKAVLKR